MPSPDRYRPAEKLRAVEREIKFRHRVYAREVATGRMTQAECDFQIGVFMSIAADYAKLVHADPFDLAQYAGIDFAEVAVPPKDKPPIPEEDVQAIREIARLSSTAQCLTPASLQGLNRIADVMLECQQGKRNLDGHPPVELRVRIEAEDEDHDRADQPHV